MCMLREAFQTPCGHDALAAMGAGMGGGMGGGHGAAAAAANVETGAVASNAEAHGHAMYIYLTK